MLTARCTGIAMISVQNVSMRFGNERLWSALQAREALYAKPSLSDDDGMRLGELEGSSKQPSARTSTNAILDKLYGNTHDAKSSERRYSPAQCIGTVPTGISGRPDPSTSALRSWSG